MEVDESPSTQEVSDRGVLPEVDAYAYLLVVIYLIDAQQLPQVDFQFPITVHLTLDHIFLKVQPFKPS